MPNSNVKQPNTRLRLQSKIDFPASSNNPKQSGSQANTSTMDAGEAAPVTGGGEDSSKPILDAINALKTDFTGRFDGIMAAIEGIRREVGDCVMRVTETESRLSNAEDTVNNLKATVEHLEKVNKELELKVLDGETRSRRCNLRLINLNLDEKKVPDAGLCAFLEEWIPKTLGVKLTTKAFLGRVHRLGQRRDSNGRPRAIIMQFQNDRDKTAVWNAASGKKLFYDKKPVWFHRDLPTDTYKKLKRFDAARQKFRALKVRCGIQLPACKLLVTYLNRTHSFEDPEDAEVFAGRIDRETDGRGPPQEDEETDLPPQEDGERQETEMQQMPPLEV